MPAEKWGPPSGIDGSPLCEATRSGVWGWDEPVAIPILSFEGLVPSFSFDRIFSSDCLFFNIEPIGWRACMKPEPRGVALGLLMAGFALAVVLAIAQVRPADLEAPGLKFVSPGIARK